jgi:hypothetical protein
MSRNLTMKRLIAIFLACAQLALAGETSVHWRDLGSLLIGKDVILTLADGARVKGTAESIDAVSVVIDTKKRARQSIRRRDVRDVRVAQRANYKWRLIGTALGAGVGAAISVPILTETHNEGSGKYDSAAAALVGGLAAVGLLVGWRADHARDLIRVLPD